MSQNLRMKCVLVSSDSGKTWTIIRTDYLISPYKGGIGEGMSLKSNEYEGITLSSDEHQGITLSKEDKEGAVMDSTPR
jgi:hypothetical protein